MIYVMTFRRTNESINKAEDAGRLDLQIGLADGLRRNFRMALAVGAPNADFSVTFLNEAADT